ncbi:putative radical SAM protein YgiQ [Plasticicumulans lactativorans]|uniref:Putative radical SAM protein YgiQ n=1 Tax=Plasticicumulans lactativorans TaxID=1133106 RepID=A0A4R2L841_9GAMM|nr:YgiQ family radical SAM protein [Plasticicumulans lactativorans]TCO83161.1 putative radical SAM protein YgiQ [Plasticicumulans lactativorans]
MSTLPVPRNLFSHRKFWAHRLGPAPFLPMSRAEMDALGWDSCDIIIVTGDAYVDHPSFGMAVIGRVLEAQGFRVGIIAQPDWTSAAAFRALGRPNLFFGVAAGNMDSMVNRYTADRRVRSNDAYTPDDAGGRRPDRAVIVYSQRCREAYAEVPVVIGGIEASLRRIAHYDYWSDKVRRSVLIDSKADLLVYGNAERAIVEIAHRSAAGEQPRAMTDIRGTAFVRSGGLPEDWLELDSSTIDTPGAVEALPNPYAETPAAAACAPRPSGEAGGQPLRFERRGRHPRERTVIRLPAFEQVRDDPVLYAHASRALHLETNPGNARALVQRHGDRDVWLNPPPLPLGTAEMDRVFDLPYARVPHPAYGAARIPAYEMIRFSVNIMRGCFGGCTFCSITEHEGRIIQSRSEDSILREIEDIRDKTPGFTGVISDLGGPTANMYRLACKSPEIERSCRKLSCVWPDICSNLNTDHAPLVQLYRKARSLPGIKKILIASGLRYDLAVRDPAYVKELVTHHVGGYLKIAPEHTEAGPLSKMMKPGIGSYDRFKAMFEQFSQAAGKEQYLIPYFIAAHPGTSDEDMMNLARWLKRNGFRADQVQAFLPSPMALATAMYHSGRNPLKGIKREGGETVVSPKGLRQRRLHKAFLRYHDPENWPMLREALKAMGRADLIGNGKHHLVPAFQPAGTGLSGGEGRRGIGKRPAQQPFTTQHTGLPPRADGTRVPRGGGARNDEAARSAASGRGFDKRRRP